MKMIENPRLLAHTRHVAAERKAQAILRRRHQTRTAVALIAGAARS